MNAVEKLRAAADDLSGALLREKDTCQAIREVLNQRAIMKDALFEIMLEQDMSYCADLVNNNETTGLCDGEQCMRCHQIHICREAMFDG